MAEDQKSILGTIFNDTFVMLQIISSNKKFILCFECEETNSIHTIVVNELIAFTFVSCNKTLHLKNRLDDLLPRENTIILRLRLQPLLFTFNFFTLKY